MSAILAIRKAHAAGVELAIDGDTLTLTSSASPLTFVGERARMAAVHGLTESDAEARAFACCVVEWPAWHAGRKAEAMAALANLGITTSRTNQ
jgi:hypothetical protein